MLRELYTNEIRDSMWSHFGYTNVMEVPKLSKVCINVGTGVVDSKLLDNVASNLMMIAAQKPVLTKARKSISAFKLRAGQHIGVKVTLRGNRMYYFLERTLAIALPRTRDFRGCSAKQFDGRGNFTFSIKEHVVYPEVDYSKVSKVFGMNITVATTARTNEEAKFLLAALGFPFRD